VTTQVAEGDADRYGVVQTDGERITDYVLKPENPRGNQVSNEIFVFDPKPAMELLERLAEDADPDEGIQDLGHQLLPALVSQGCARGHPFEGYWRDVGTLEAYHGAHMDLLGADPRFVLDAPDWPLLTRGGRRGPSRALHEVRLDDVLLSPSTTVSGTIERSVLSPGVVVEPGAVVRDSVLLHDVVVRAGASCSARSSTRALRSLKTHRSAAPTAWFWSAPVSTSEADNPLVRTCQRGRCRREFAGSIRAAIAHRLLSAWPQGRQGRPHRRELS